MSYVIIIIQICLCGSVCWCTASQSGPFSFKAKMKYMAKICGLWCSILWRIEFSVVHSINLYHKGNEHWGVCTRKNSAKLPEIFIENLQLNTMSASVT